MSVSRRVNSLLVEWLSIDQSSAIEELIVKHASCTSRKLVVEMQWFLNVHVQESAIFPALSKDFDARA